MGLPNIGAILPFELREQLAKQNFKIGSVFRFHCNKANKEKRLILVGVKYDKILVAFVHINTELNNNVFNTPALKLENIPIFKDENRNYIDHDSFINCSDLVVRDKDEIYNLLLHNPSIHLGNLSENDNKIVRTAICNSKVLRRDRKKDFGLFIP